MTINSLQGPEGPATTTLRRPRSSRHRYHGFRKEYKRQRLDDLDGSDGDAAKTNAHQQRRGKRREYVREYLHWLWPYHYGVAGLFALALVAGGLEMVEPLFLRFIIDRVLLNSKLDAAARLPRLHTAGVLFVGLVVISKL